MTQPRHHFQKDLLKVNIYEERNQMGEAAASFVVTHLRNAIAQKGTANLILATGTSQFTFLDALKTKDIDWQKIKVFHLDEYTGLSDQHPASFRKYLQERILDIVKPGMVHLIHGDAQDLEKEIEDYEKLLKQNPIDVDCIGIGENGHIAFNDPPVADFNDPRWVKVVELDHDCRMQQWSEGWFPTLEDVPKNAVTLTIPAILKSRTISCVVPDERKSAAIYNTLFTEISTECPATILRKHPAAVLFLDLPAASGIQEKIF